MLLREGEGRVESLQLSLWKPTIYYFFCAFGFRGEGYSKCPV